MLVIAPACLLFVQPAMPLATARLAAPSALACQLLPPDEQPDPEKQPGYPKKTPLEPWTLPWLVDEALTFMSWGFFLVIIIPVLFVSPRVNLGGTLAARDADFVSTPSERNRERLTEAELYGRPPRVDVLDGAPRER